jgi:hypothetical protein
MRVFLIIHRRTPKNSLRDLLIGLAVLATFHAMGPGVL